MTETVTDEKYEKAMRDFSRRVVHEVAPDVLADEYRKGYVDGQKAAVGAGLSGILAEVAAAATTECPYCHACWPECLHCDGTGLDTPRAPAAAPQAEAQELSRIHHVLKKHGVHQGRTDDRLSDVIDRALTKGTSCR